MAGTFPPQQPGLLYLTEGGQETEVTYKHGFELPEFAMFTLLDNPDAMSVVRQMYEDYLDTAARHGVGVFVGGMDYRASPDWSGKLGYSLDELDDYQRRNLEFLREVSEPYRDRVPSIVIVGAVGPRGDAYTLNESPMTPDEAHQYHRHQIGTLARSGADLAMAMTFNSVPEAVGVALAGAEFDIPVCASFTLDSNHRLHSGPSLREAIEAVDELAGDARPAFFGINCSHPYEFMPALEPGDWFERVRCLRPNAAMMDKISLCTLGHLEIGDPPVLGQIMGDLARRYPHIDIWGGCCGTWDQHLDLIATEVLAARAG